jgi:hypothetical protein
VTTRPPQYFDVPRFGARQHATYVAIAFGIWLTGVVIVRLLPNAAFDTDELWPILLFVASIGLGVVMQLVIPVLVRLAPRDTLVPVMVICGAALMMDGIAIAFTEIYSSETAVNVVVGGWLLWTFGTQIIISIIMIGLASPLARGDTFTATLQFSSGRTLDVPVTVSDNPPR